MLDVTRLRVLVAVARHGSVTAAARALNYAQPSVSHHLSRLEAETGALLTQRAGRGVRLTDAGRLLAERAEEILGRLDAAENELAAHVGLRQAGSGWPPSPPRSARWCRWPRPGSRRRIPAWISRSPRLSHPKRCGCSGPDTWMWPWCSGITRTGPRSARPSTPTKAPGPGCSSTIPSTW